MITTKQLADRWCTSREYLANLRNQGKSCPYIILGRRVVYREKDVKQHEADRRVAVEFIKPRAGLQSKKVCK